MSVSVFFQHFREAITELSLLYVLFSIPFFLVFWVIWKKKFRAIRIQETEQATNHHFWHDLRHSLQSILIFGVMDVVLIYLESKGYTLMYYEVDKYGWLWIIASFFLFLFLNDTFFYWSHRAMHHPKLYRFFHRVHHESTDPSPLTSFAFHPSEAVVENLMGFVLPFILPLHFGVILAWQLVDMLNNVLGHLGYEVYPKGWTKTPVLKFLTTSTHHNMHHQQFDGNYALYFTWWDKWMGTEFPDYEQRHEQIFERNKKQNTPVMDGPELSIGPVTEVTALVYGREYKFSTEAGHTILESALEQGIPLPHSCKKGLCGTCKMKCTEGEVWMKSRKALSEAEAREGYVLSCQSIPQSSKLKLETE